MLHYSVLLLALLAVLHVTVGQVVTSLCYAGEYLSSGVCTPCPTGFYCFDGTSTRLCGSGKVPNVNATACDWDGTTVCSPGTYINPSPANSAPFCTNCTALSTCAGGLAAPVACAPGEYVNNAATSCVIPTSCNPGEYLVGVTGCFPCPSGSSCTGGTAAAVACSAGQVPNLALTACVTSSSTCSSGNFLYNNICLDCSNLFRPTCAGGTSGLVCNDDVHATTNCIQCPTNGICGSPMNPNRNIYCRANNWGSLTEKDYMINELGTECIPIPKGPCPSSSYYNSTLGGIPVCDECPVGKFCPGGGAPARTCPLGLVPGSLVAADRCVAPVTNCTYSGQILRMVFVCQTYIS
jgi:hypothetical protein